MIYIMRGLPGSGKSYIAYGLEAKHDIPIISADNFHMVKGIYQYDPKNAGSAHNWCLRSYLSLTLKSGCVKGCIVDNTNTTLMELAPYVRTAEAYGLSYEILYVNTPLSTCLRRQAHNVPHNTMLQMQANLLTECVPPYWKQRIVDESTPFQES